MLLLLLGQGQLQSTELVGVLVFVMQDQARESQHLHHDRRGRREVAGRVGGGLSLAKRPQGGQAFEVISPLLIAPVPATSFGI